MNRIILHIRYTVLCVLLIMGLMGQMLYVHAAEVKLPILLYHNLAEEYDPSLAVLHCPPAQFEEHMKALKAAGYHTITFAEYADYVENGTALPDKPIIVSFDDGYTSNYQYAYPTLKKLGMKATIFAITGRMGVSDTIYPHFTWEQAREMEQSGVIDIESHTDFHREMVKLTPAETALEVRRSYYMLANELNKTPVAMAYPYGLPNEYSAQIAREAGFRVQCIVTDTGVNKKSDGLTGLHRLSVSGGMSGADVLAMIDQNMGA